jgi:hypothetical protein
MPIRRYRRVEAVLCVLTGLGLPVWVFSTHGFDDYRHPIAAGVVFIISCVVFVVQGVRAWMKRDDP